MKSRLIRFSALLATVAALTVFLPSWGRVSAQGTAMTQTTLAAALDASVSSTQLQLTSATGVTVGNLLYVDREAFLVKAINGVYITIQRARIGTTMQAHASGAVVWTAPPSAFYSYTPPPGPCTASQYAFLPWINTANGDVLNCHNSTWVRNSVGGYPTYSPRLAANGQSAMTYTASGAIAVQQGTVFINGTTLAMTIVDPLTSQNGLTMLIIATNASAHTLTYTAGFDGGTTARDVATFGGAVGDNIFIQAVNGVWWVISSRNITLG